MKKTISAFDRNLLVLQKQLVEKISSLSVPDMISVYARVVGLDPGLVKAALPHFRKAFAAIETYREKQRLRMGRRVRELEKSMQVEDPLPAGSSPPPHPSSAGPTEEDRRRIGGRTARGRKNAV